MTSQIKKSIMIELNQCGQITGIFHLGYHILGTHDIAWLRKKLRELESEGQIEIQCFGNGKAKTIKRSPDCHNPGYQKLLNNRRKLKC